MGANIEVDNLVLYDGVCTFCNSSVNFILDHEQDASLYFTPLQSEKGQAILKQYDLPLNYTDSLLFVKNGVIFSHAMAAFRIANFLKTPWNWISAFRFLPSFITNFFYKLVAQHRYKLMGQADACMLPSPSVKERFLE